jgi:hypothetical protein
MTDALRDAANLIRRHAPVADRVRLAVVADWLDAEAAGNPLNPVDILVENLELTSEADQLRAALEKLLTGAESASVAAGAGSSSFPVRPVRCAAGAMRGPSCGSSRKRR